MELKGIYTALVTPFRGGALDEKALKKLIEFQVAGGVDGIVPCGTTGEAPTLSYEEHEKVIELAIKYAGGKVPVIAGTGSNSTAEAIELTMSAKKLGADACLLTTPYYNKPTQAGLLAHFTTIQHTGPHGHQHGPGNDSRAGEGAQHRRHQGGRGVIDAGLGDLSPDKRQVRHPLR